MNRDDDLIAQLEDYLDSFDGVTPLPVRVRDAVRADLPRTRQVRPARGMGRVLDMISQASTPARWGVAAAVVVAAVVLGAAFVNRDGGLPAVGAAATPSPSPSTSPTPTASPAPAAMLKDAPHAACSPGGSAPDCLAPGTYRLTGNVWPGDITMEVPAGWFEWQPYSWEDAYDALLVYAGPGGASGWGVSFIGVAEVAKDPCDPAKGTYPRAETGTVDGLVAAMSRWPGFESTAPAPIVVGGYSGQLIELTSTRTGLDCPDGTLWKIPQGMAVDAYPMVGARGPAARPGTFRIVDVNGTLLVIRTTDFPETSPNELSGGVPDAPTRHAADQVVMQQILDSIRITGAPPQP